MSTEQVAASSSELYPYYSGKDKKPLSSLPAEELETAKTAILKVLNSPASTVLANLIDGKPFPNETAWEVSLAPPPEPSKTSFNRYYKEIESFDLGALEVNGKILEEYTSAQASTPYKLDRLLEIILTAIHTLAIKFYTEADPPPEDFTPKDLLPAPYPFIVHSQYYASKPWKGIIDLKAVGFWAEAQIFGGVVYFDRGHSADPEKHKYEGLWLHGLPGYYTSSLWKVPESSVQEAVEKGLLPFDPAPAEKSALLTLQEGQEGHLIYREAGLVTGGVYEGDEHSDAVVGLTDEDLEEIKSMIRTE